MQNECRFSVRLCFSFSFHTLNSKTDMYKTCIKAFKILYNQYKNPEDKQPDLDFPFEKNVQIWPKALLLHHSWAICNKKLLMSKNGNISFKNYYIREMTKGFLLSVEIHVHIFCWFRFSMAGKFLPSQAEMLPWAPVYSRGFSLFLYLFTIMKFIYASGKELLLFATNRVFRKRKGTIIFRAMKL